MDGHWTLRATMSHPSIHRAAALPREEGTRHLPTTAADCIKAAITAQSVPCGTPGWPTMGICGLTVGSVLLSPGAGVKPHTLNIKSANVLRDPVLRRERGSQGRPRRRVRGRRARRVSCPSRCVSSRTEDVETGEAHVCQKPRAEAAAEER